MPTNALSPEILAGREFASRKFDPRSAAPFVNKSVSEATRRAYSRAVADFFRFVGGKHPTEVVPADVQRWRDHLRAQRKRPATVSFKLSVIRSFFEYLKAAGVVPLNPASTKLVAPPELVLPLVYLFLQKRGYSIEANYVVWLIALPLVLAILWWPRLPQKVEGEPIRDE